MFVAQFVSLQLGLRGDAPPNQVSHKIGTNWAELGRVARFEHNISRSRLHTTAVVRVTFSRPPGMVEFSKNLM
jgi:hypothetical protein